MRGSYSSTIEGTADHAHVTEKSALYYTGTVFNTPPSEAKTVSQQKYHGPHRRYNRTYHPPKSEPILIDNFIDACLRDVPYPVQVYDGRKGTRPTQRRISIGNLYRLYLAWHERYSIGVRYGKVSLSRGMLERGYQKRLRAEGWFFINIETTDLARAIAGRDIDYSYEPKEHELRAYSSQRNRQSEPGVQSRPSSDEP